MTNREYCKLLDKNYGVVPMTDEYSFEEVFMLVPDILNKFLSDVIGVKLPKNHDIKIATDEVLKDYWYKNYDFNMHLVLDYNVFIDTKLDENILNEKDFIDKLNKFKIYGEPVGKDFIYNDDYTDRILYWTTMKAKPDTVVDVTSIKYTKYYRYLYYEKGVRDKDVIWLTALTAESYSELYELLRQVLSEKEIDKMISCVKFMSLDEYTECMENKSQVKKFRTERNVKTEIVRNMLKENIDIDTIVKITGLTKEIVIKIKDAEG